MGNGLSLTNYYDNYENGFNAKKTGMGRRTSTGSKGYMINFEDVQSIIGVSGSGSKRRAYDQFLLISTLDAANQEHVIKSTILAQDEEERINEIISGKNDDAENIMLVVYGKHVTDEKVITKYNQLKSLGFSNVIVYPGGMFEWLLLQDIYGADLFPITSTNKCLDIDILEYRPPSIL
jgi:rhodanese-related sulfurtransferase